MISLLPFPGLAMAGPWGGKDDEERKGGSGGEGGTSSGPRNPWTHPPRSGGQGSGGGEGGGGRPSLIDDLMRRGRESFGGGGGGSSGGGGFTGGDGRSLWSIALAIILVLWIALTSVHRIGPQERGVVMLLGSYSRTMTPGIGLTLPAPLETVETVDVEEIRTVDVGSVSGEGQNLVLTGDQNIIDLAYSVRWNIRSAELYKFALKDPDATVQEVAETAMRSVLATISLNEALGAGRTGVEQQVALRMQEILDSYRSGIRIQGVAIKQADPPNEVNDAFKEVSAAKQDADTYVNQATAYAQQLKARAQGEAAAFDKVYEQYKLSPEVTRRRMYYETMEAILADTDKTIVESNNVMPYLPLPEIKRKAKEPGNTTVVEGNR
ncbi:MAG: protease modulator HflK [Sphingomonadaceae bacterium]|jgi:membrane protease subunit HflK